MSETDLIYTSLEDHTNYKYITDIEIASTLLCKGYKMADIVIESKRKSSFVFEQHPSLEDVIKGFWGNRIEVPPLEFANHRKNLKSQIFSSQNNN